VESISWHEAAAFTNALSSAAGLDLCFDCTGSQAEVECSLASSFSTPYDCPGWRLPTEAEWEFSARAGTRTAMSNGGDLLGSTTRSCDGKLELSDGSILDNIAIYCGNSDEHPAEVGTLYPNPWSLFDMHGNVWEWCFDGWDGSSDYTGDATDPTGDSTASARVVRGGSWEHKPRTTRSAERGALSEAGASVGLRLVRND
jgi:formylglycine-generating enzyme required for sulfatase activity